MESCSGTSFAEKSRLRTNQAQLKTSQQSTTHFKGGGKRYALTDKSALQ